MTPLQIPIALHYYVSPKDYRDGDFSAPAVRSAIDDFLHDGMLKERVCGDIGYGTYEATDRLNVYVEKLMEIDLPIQRWVME